MRTASTLLEAPREVWKIARYTRIEMRLAYRRVGFMTALEVGLRLPPHILRLWWRDKLRDGSDE